MGWQACVWARLGEGERAYDVLNEDFRRHMLPNLMINSHGIPQVGDAFGIPSTMLELLVWSHEGEIVLLPAWPKAWGSGSVKGLRVRGKHTIDMEWVDGELKSAVIWNHKGCKDMPIRVKNPGNYQFVITEEKTVIIHK